MIFLPIMTLERIYEHNYITIKHEPNYIVYKIYKPNLWSWDISWTLPIDSVMRKINKACVSQILSVDILHDVPVKDIMWNLKTCSLHTSSNTGLFLLCSYFSERWYHTHVNAEREFFSLFTKVMAVQNCWMTSIVKDQSHFFMM